MIYYWIAISVLFLFLLASIYYNYKFGVLLLNVQDTLEDSLDVLDERYDSISRVLEIPIFYDSKEVRQVISDIEASRNAILNIARQLTVVDVVEQQGEVVEEEQIA